MGRKANRDRARGPQRIVSRWGVPPWERHCPQWHRKESQSGDWRSQGLGLRLAIPGPQAHATMNSLVAHPLTRVALVGTPNATDGVWEGPPNADLCVGDPEPFPPWVKRTPSAPHVIAGEVSSFPRRIVSREMHLSGQESRVFSPQGTQGHAEGRNCSERPSSPQSHAGHADRRHANPGAKDRYSAAGECGRTPTLTCHLSLSHLSLSPVRPPSSVLRLAAPPREVERRWLGPGIRESETQDRKGQE
jgi:hypothetical protein